jgi:hypothetical protein
MHTPQSTHMHFRFVHRRFTAAQCSTSGGASRLSRRLVVSAFTSPPSSTRIAQSTQTGRSAAARAALEHCGYDARCACATHPPQSTRHYDFCPLVVDLLAAQCSSLGAAWSVSGLLTSLFQHARASTTQHALLCPLQIHCSSVQHSLGAAWSVSSDAHCFSMHTPQSTHMHCFVHCRFTAAQCAPTCSGA